jgi:hypothetical protein
LDVAAAFVHAVLPLKNLLCSFYIYEIEFEEVRDNHWIHLIQNKTDKESSRDLILKLPWRCQSTNSKALFS